ncbi:transcriptional regulator, TetR family [Promicromonospora umidemergens]|uniref:TetR/AcrR family transcriptional regulator n=1 Tax=Promicromonospora umidemergens TaxID=629679 RepID=A0ABP8XHV9_9MICO|nr:TetR/AcrR family transcriptional regulator [Promicromonospora umidemergens]MCP2284949.1 transcriptional regulator, TetR family [Promicromonospora umidemergens]
MAAERRARVPFGERREQILQAALREFSHKGLHGGSTMTIAAEVGVSQPNIFRIFPTKREIFVATLQRVFTNVATTMLAAGERDPEQPLQAMADGWGKLMEERENMLMLLQGYAASEDPVIRDLMQNWTRDVFERMEALPGVGQDVAHDFFAAGMLYMVAAAMDLPTRADSDAWAERFLDSGS